MNLPFSVDALPGAGKVPGLFHTGFFLLIMSLAVVSCASRGPVPPSTDDAPPAWVLKTPVYPDRICAVGSCGETFVRDDAKPCAADAARESLAKSVSVKVQSIMVDENVNGNQSVESAGLSSVQGTTTETVLNGAVVESYWFDKTGKVSNGGTFALACISNGRAGVGR